MPDPARWRRVPDGGRGAHARRPAGGIDDLAQLRRPGREAREARRDRLLGEAQGAAIPVRQADAVGRFARAEAAIAAARHAWAEGAAAARDDGAQAGLAARDHDADVASALALRADRLAGQLRAPAHGRGGQQLHELAGVDGAASQLGVHRDVVGHGRGGGQRVHVLRAGIHGADDAGQAPVMAGPGPQRLDATTRGAGADRHQQGRAVAQVTDVAQLLVRAHGAFHEEDVEGALRGAPRGGLAELHDAEAQADVQQAPGRGPGSPAGSRRTRRA